jgi:hypothetical protein
VRARVVATLALVACRGREPPTVTVASAPAAPSSAPQASPAPWPDARRVVAADGSFSLAYPARTFVRADARGATVTLASDVSEPSFSGRPGGDIVYSVALTKLETGVIDELRKQLGPVQFLARFPDGTEGSFRPEPTFIDRETGERGARGYVVRRGVEGTGDELHVFTSRNGRVFRFDCNFCCGMMAKPRMTERSQLELCDAALRQFEREQ